MATTAWWVATTSEAGFLRAIFRYFPLSFDKMCTGLYPAVGAGGA